MKKNAFIIHGAYGAPEENWFPWLKDKLGHAGYDVFAPKFPTPEGQNLSAWREIFYELIPLINSETILIGHSLGPAFILDIIEYLNSPIKAAFLVAPFIGLLNNPEFDTINHSITAKHFDWDNINDNCTSFYIYYSDNDPYVPMSKSEFLGKKLKAKLKVVKNGGHINSSSGYEEIDIVFQDIQNL